MPVTEPASCTHLCYRICYSIFGILIGIAGVVVLLVAWELDSDHRYASVAYAGLSGALSAWNFILHLMHLQDLWRTWLKGLKLFFSAGIVFICLSVISFLVFIIVAAANKEPFTADSFYVTALWCAWSAKWSFLLFWHSKKYRSEFADLTALLDF